MPLMRKLTEEEVWLKEKPTSKRQQIEWEYDVLLSDLSDGDYAIATLEDGEKKQTVRNRLQAAALRRDMLIRFFRTRDTSIIFRLTQIYPEPLGEEDVVWEEEEEPVETQEEFAL